MAAQSSCRCRDVTDGEAYLYERILGSKHHLLAIGEAEKTKPLDDYSRALYD